MRQATLEMKLNRGVVKSVANFDGGSTVVESWVQWLALGHAGAGDCGGGVFVGGEVMGWALRVANCMAETRVARDAANEVACQDSCMSLIIGPWVAFPVQFFS